MISIRPSEMVRVTRVVAVIVGIRSRRVRGLSNMEYGAT